MHLCKIGFHLRIYYTYMSCLSCVCVCVVGSCVCVLLARVCVCEGWPGIFGYVSNAGVS